MTADFRDSCGPCTLTDQPDECVKGGIINQGLHDFLHRGKETNIEVALFPTVKVGYWFLPFR
jgi:hypothetical protein